MSGLLLSPMLLWFGSLFFFGFNCLSYEEKAEARHQGAASALHEAIIEHAEAITSCDNQTGPGG